MRSSVPGIITTQAECVCSECVSRPSWMFILKCFSITGALRRERVPQTRHNKSSILWSWLSISNTSVWLILFPFSPRCYFNGQKWNSRARVKSCCWSAIWNTLQSHKNPVNADAKAYTVFSLKQRQIKRNEHVTHPLHVTHQISSPSRYH